MGNMNHMQFFYNILEPCEEMDSDPSFLDSKNKS
jgi:hypothetical protein